MGTSASRPDTVLLNRNITSRVELPSAGLVAPKSGGVSLMDRRKSPYQDDDLVLLFLLALILQNVEIGAFVNRQ